MNWHIWSPYCNTLPFKELPLLVALALPPKPTMTAVSIALFPLPFFPTIKLVLGFKKTSIDEWHMKFLMCILSMMPALVSWKCHCSCQEFYELQSSVKMNELMAFLCQSSMLWSQGHKLNPRFRRRWMVKFMFQPYTLPKQKALEDTG